jgi:DNA-binding PadR family transcriptional regulator
MNIVTDDDVENLNRIGWFQLQLLMQCAFQAKYGYEIINDLRLNNINMSTGQIYPALKKLVKSGHLKTFSKRGRAARRKYYQITKKGIDDLRRTIRSTLINLIPVMYTLIDDLKLKLYRNYRIERGDTILLYSYPIKNALIDLARLVGDTGKILITVNGELTRQTILDLAEFDHFEQVIQPVTISTDFTIDIPKESANQAILLLFQKEKEIDLLMNEVKRIVKPGGRILLLSTNLNVFTETFLAFFDFFTFLEFFNGYTVKELKVICLKAGLNIEGSEDIKKIIVIEAAKPE